jgi:type III secretory pathway component EscS
MGRARHRCRRALMTILIIGMATLVVAIVIGSLINNT